MLCVCSYVLVCVVNELEMTFFDTMSRIRINCQYYGNFYHVGFAIKYIIRRSKKKKTQFLKSVHYTIMVKIKQISTCSDENLKKIYIYMHVPIENNY